jgi:predicted nucleic acid-binding protein
MSGFLLDTNIPSELMRVQPQQEIQAWIATQRPSTLFISVVSLGELRKGIALRSLDKRRNQLETWFETEIPRLFSGRILPVTRSIAELWGTLEAKRERAGRPLHVPDAQIAATALEHDLTLVTRNEKDFVDLGLTIFNPWNTA